MCAEDCFPSPYYLDHFKPLWGKNVPQFGIAHALALGLAPWLAAEIPHLVGKATVTATASAKEYLSVFFFFGIQAQVC